MKISVQGTIIDTEDIYRISPITKDEKRHIYFTFTIFFFNNKTHTISLKSGCYWDGDKYISIDSRGGGPYTKAEEEYYDFKGDPKEFILNHPLYKERFKQVDKLRDKIISYWSDNQSKIPQLEL